MKIIAYYLPQYHPIKENNEWWGEGFTEWTNVAKAKKLFRKHDQPKIPSDLGFYDLRIPEIRQKQADLAFKYGITGFCYWHYWFGNGKRLLETPLNEVLKLKEPNFPFCLGWANESWKAKVWNNDSTGDKTLVEQEYPSKEDIINHFYEILPAFKDQRYLRIENRPVFVIYKPLLLKDASLFMSVWNELVNKNSISESIFFIGHTIDSNEKDKILSLGFDAINVVRIGEHRFNKSVIKKIFIKLIRFKFFNYPLVLNYKFISKYFINESDTANDIFPTLIPNWDHTPRSGKKGVVFNNSTPELFKLHIKKALDVIKNKPKERQILFLKSWNEWGEGNYLEPDIRFGKKNLEVLKSTIDEFESLNKQ